MKTLNSKKIQAQGKNSLNKNLPLVSIVVPTHNRAHLIRDCLESVVNQTYKNIEVVVVNDNSEDDTEDILIEYETKYSFFKFYKSEGKGGNAARNLGIEKSKGEYVALMDDDDVCELDRVEHQMSIIINNKFSYDFIISSFYIIRSNGKKETSFSTPMESKGYPQRWLVKRQRLIEIGGFDIEQPALQDVECFWRLKQNSRIYFDSTPVVRIRSTDISITKDHVKMIRGIKRLLELFGEKMSAYERNVWIITLCKKYAELNSWEEYSTCLKHIYIFQAPFSKIFLAVTMIVKNKKILAFHSKLFQKYLKVRKLLISFDKKNHS